MLSLHSANVCHLVVSLSGSFQCLFFPPQESLEKSVVLQRADNNTNRKDKSISCQGQRNTGGKPSRMTAAQPDDTRWIIFCTMNISYPSSTVYY